MRSGETRHLLVKDVEIQDNWIQIRSRDNAPTKTGEDWKVPIHPRLRKLLNDLPRKKQGWFFTSLPSPRYPVGDHHLNTKHLNEDFLAILKKLGLPTGRKDGGFTVHSLRHFFKTCCINSGIPKPVVDQWQGHAPGKKPSDGYYHLSDTESQRFMENVPFGDGAPAANTGISEKESDNEDV